MPTEKPDPLPRLPEELEGDLSLVHADICDCNQMGLSEKNCNEVRDILRRAILAWGLRERAEGIEYACHSDDMYVHGECDRAMAELRAQAAELEKRDG